MSSPNSTYVYSEKKRRQFRRIDVLLSLVVLALTVTNLILLKQNRSLKAEMASSPRETLQQGSRLPSFAANTISGKRRTVDFSASEKTVLLVFQADCPACDRIVSLWKDIKTNCDRRQFQTFGLSLDNQTKTSSFLKDRGLNLESFAGLDATFKNRYGLHETPLTIVINRTGHVERVWVGAPDDGTTENVRDYFRSL